MNFDNVFSWAEDANGHLVHVDSVPRGLECGCFCPNCHEPLVARQGDILEHGFAHHSKSRSSTLKICYQVTLYKLAEQIIKEKKCVYAPSYYGIFKEHLLCFNDVQIDKRYKREDKQPDVIGIAEDGAVYIIELTFEGKVERKEAIDYKNTNHLVINLSGQSLESLERFLLSSEKNKKWLNNDSYFTQIPEVYKKAGKNVRVVPISECDHCILATDCCGVKKPDTESYLLVENNGQSFRICKDDEYTEKKTQKEEQDKSKTHKNKNGKWLKKISGLILKKIDSEIRAGSTVLYNKEHLMHAGGWGAEFEFLFFWGHHEKGEHVTRACLSQWYPCQFEVDGVQYNCAEQFMMAEKARLFGDTEVLEKILAATDQKTIKDLGRKVRGFDEDKWNKEKVNIVISGNIAKFSQNWKLKKYLIWTGDKILAEASPYDTIWGIGLKATDERATDITQWRGENLLGFSLMIVRDKFLNMKKNG